MRLFIFIVALITIIPPVNAQDEKVMRELQSDLDEYEVKVAPLGIHIAFSQPQYVAGDTAFFAVHLTDNSGRMFLEGRSIITLRLMAMDGRNLLQQKIFVKDGYGHNQIRLPANLPGGDYYVLAYTEGMAAINPDMVYSTMLRVAESKETVKLQSQKLHFFPEGGSIIPGATNRLVLSGPPETEGIILKSNGAQITKFRFDKHGFTSVYLNVESGFEYFASFQGMRYALPAFKHDRIAVMLSPIRDRALKAVVQVSESSPLRDSTVHVVVTNNNQIFYSAFFNLRRKNSAVLNIPVDGLPDGINRLTFMSSTMDVYAERLFFNQSETDIIAKIECDDAFDVRQNVSLRVTTTDSLRGTGVASKLSVSVFNEDVCPAESFDLASLSLSDVRYHSDKISPSELDNYLISKKDEVYAWEQVGAVKKSSRRYYNGLITMRGQVKSLSRDVTIKDSTFVSFFVQNDVMGYQTYTDKDGRFVVPMLVSFFGDDEVLYEVQQNGKVIDEVTIDLEPEPAINRPVLLRGYSAKYSPHFQYVEDMRAIDSAFQATTLLSKMIEPDEAPTSFLEEEVFGADHVILLSDYTLFPTMEETFREIVPYVSYRSQGSKQFIHVTLDDEVLATGNPILVIDGILTNNIDYLMNLNPADVYAVKIIRSPDKLRTFGAIGRNGVLIIETKIPGNHVNVRRSVHSFRIRGLNPAAESFSANRPEKTGRAPDLRLNLCWNPKVETSADGKAEMSFTTGDATGKFRIVVNGITLEGRPFSASKIITVNYRKEASN